MADCSRILQNDAEQSWDKVPPKQPLRRVGQTGRVRSRTEADITLRRSSQLNSKRDVGGEELIARDEGPTYENMVDYLRPMMWIGDYVTTSCVYCFVFGRQDKRRDARHVGMGIACLLGRGYDKPTA
jgi:hypothetical protein